MACTKCGHAEKTQPRLQALSAGPLPSGLFRDLGARGLNCLGKHHSTAAATVAGSFQPGLVAAAKEHRAGAEKIAGALEGSAGELCTGLTGAAGIIGLFWVLVKGIEKMGPS